MSNPELYINISHDIELDGGTVTRIGPFENRASLDAVLKTMGEGWQPVIIETLPELPSRFTAQAPISLKYVFVKRRWWHRLIEYFQRPQNPWVWRATKRQTVQVGLEKE